MKKINGIKKPERKSLLIMAAAVVLVAASTLAFLVMDSGKAVEFRVLNHKDIPQEIARDVIPEYRSLERALACMVDDKVYVVVTRGEKPASGYTLDISKIRLETDDGKENLVVNAVFRDPAKNDSMSQIVTYPVKVAETDLKRLPDEIELRVRYEE